MRIDILINGNAGRANQLEIESRVRRVLFRCELHFHAPQSIETMRSIVEAASEAGSDYLIISGGDGTLNACLAPIVKRYHAGLNLPPICLVPVGTANDLAFTLNIPRRIEQAARAILEGRVDRVNVLEIKSGEKTAHMITNGGLGIPAETAETANRLRSWVKSEAKNAPNASPRQRIFRLGEKIITRAGPKIYEILLIRDIARWDTRSWELELELEGYPSIRTQAPFILFNNQPSLAGGILTAPLTSHADGKFNVLIGEPTRLLPQVRAIWEMRQGRMPNSEDCPSYETPGLKLRVSDTSRPLTFFGDGEILHKGVREVEIRCLHPGLPFVRMPLA